MIRTIKKINTVLTWIKIDLRESYSAFFKLFSYLKDRRDFSDLMKKEYEWPLFNYPILQDRSAESASLGEYFWQDILVAKEIMKQAPNRHIDVGSRIDGFIAHLACVRKVEVLDIRPLTVQIDNLKFTQWDITQPNTELTGVADCVSCLHTLEHIGLGRYGDKLDPNGWRKGLRSLVDLVAPGGGLWLSVPIGRQRVEFNAHRVFDPATIIRSAGELGMKINRFFYLSDSYFVESIMLEKDLAFLRTEHYNLGVFYFTKERLEKNTVSRQNGVESCSLKHELR
jgi:hypothetical protein